MNGSMQITTSIISQALYQLNGRYALTASSDPETEGALWSALLPDTCS
jgi:hypothetical protein